MASEQQAELWSFGSLESNCVVTGADGRGMVVHRPLPPDEGKRQFSHTELARIIVDHNALAGIADPAAFVAAAVKAMKAVVACDPGYTGLCISALSLAARKE